MMILASAIDNFMAILAKPDNIPIIMMVGLVGFFTWISLSEGRKNDKLIEEGRRDEIIKRMQE